MPTSTSASLIVAKAPLTITAPNKTKVYGASNPALTVTYDGFKGTDDAEEGYVVKNTGAYNLEDGQVVVKVDPKYYRPTEVDLLIGDATKSREKLGWIPKYSLSDLVNDMMQSDLHLMKKDEYLKEGGFKTLSYFE